MHSSILDQLRNYLVYKISCSVAGREDSWLSGNQKMNWWLLRGNVMML